MAAIYKKEVRSYFTSMIGCVFIAFALVIIGLYFSPIIFTAVILFWIFPVGDHRRVYDPDPYSDYEKYGR